MLLDWNNRLGVVGSQSELETFTGISTDIRCNICNI